MQRWLVLFYASAIAQYSIISLFMPLLLALGVSLAGGYEHSCMHLSGDMCLEMESCAQGSVGQQTQEAAKPFSKVLAASEIPTSSVSSGATSLVSSPPRLHAVSGSPGGDGGLSSPC